MYTKLALVILLTGVAASALVVYLWNADKKRKRQYLEECLRSEYANNDY